jgi:hypothetical protein
MFFYKLNITFLWRALQNGVSYKCSRLCNSLTCSYTNAYSRCPPPTSSRFRIVFADNYSFSGLCFVLNLQLSKSPPVILFLTIFSSNTRFNLPTNIFHSLQTRPVRLLSIIQRIFWFSNWPIVSDFTNGRETKAWHDRHSYGRKAWQ